MQKTTSNYLIYSILILIICIISCRRDDYYLGDDIQIRLSTDTLRIDTVFTTVGSSTRIAKIYNLEDQPVLVDISLKNPSKSFFRFNANGAKGPEVKGVEIGANDSIYIFLEVTIDPNLPTNISPYIIEDQIIITANGAKKILYLEAWGQNANYIPSSKKGGGFPYLSCNFGEIRFDDPKPYVLYGVLVIDSCTLVLPKGTRLYVHGGVVRNTTSIYNDGLIVVQKNGKIISQGTVDQPVIIQGDRLEPEFADEKSQWVGILFTDESKGNNLKHTHIKNSIICVRVDSLADLRIENCILSNVGGSAIIGRHATISASNCLVHSCGSFAVALTFGGNYDFQYCTVANLEGADESLIINDFACYGDLCEVRKVNKLNAQFKNCIISGSAEDEISVIQIGPNADFDYLFDHCAFKIEKLLDEKETPDFLTFTKECIRLKGNDRVFNKPFDEDYRLDTMSLLLGKAIATPTITIDLVEKKRKAQPDMGCYEF